MEHERRFMWAVVVAAGAVLLLRLAFAYRWAAAGWGMHQLAFLPPWVQIGIPVLGLALILPPVAGALSRTVSDLPLPNVRPALRYCLYGLAAIAALLPFYAFRVQTHLLGDGALWIRELVGPLGRLADEPLTIALVRFLYGLAESGGEAPAEAAYRALSWGCGVLFVFLALLTAEALGRNRRERTIAAAFLLSLGTMQIFFGYAEHYGPVTVGVLLYLCMGLRFLEGRVPLAAPAGVLGLACAFHYLAFALVPSFVFLALRAWTGTRHRPGILLQAALFPLVFVGALAAIGFDFASELSRVGAERHLVPLWGGEPFMRPHALFSAVHIADVINALLLTAPMALPLCLCVVLMLRRRIDWRDAPLAFIGWAAISYLAFDALFNPEIGAFRDWDLSGVAGIPVALLGAYLLTRSVGPETQRRAAWTVAAVSLLVLIPWIWVNADSDRALQRFETILRGGDRLSVHALGSSYDELRGHYERRGDPLRALGAAEGAFEAHPRHPRYLSNVVRLLRRTGRADLIESILRGAVGATPDFVDAYRFLAQFYRETGRLHEAVYACGKALELKPDSGEMHAEMGGMLLSSGRRPEALKALERAVSLGWEDAWTYHTLGIAYGKAGRAEEGLAALRKAVSLNPYQAEVWTNLGVAAYQAGRPQESEGAFRKALSLHPENATAGSGLGMLYQRQGRMKEALGMFREASLADPKDVQVLLNLASAAFATGNVEESVSACKRVLEIEPNNRQALHNLCALYTQTGRLDEAAPYVRRYIELFPDSPEARGMRGGY